MKTWQGEKNSTNIISLSHNPVQNFLNINLATPSTVVTIHVYDLQGREMNLPTNDFLLATSSFQLNTEN
ncbi:MAG: hypothetical protein LH473_02480 [Chitinophagales bacterium]|nr:hypothetical protein [Chitinophagales bacterium]